MIFNVIIAYLFGAPVENPMRFHGWVDGLSPGKLIWKDPDSDLTGVEDAKARPARLMRTRCFNPLAGFHGR
jgi:hypothetical protein